MSSVMASLGVMIQHGICERFSWLRKKDIGRQHFNDELEKIRDVHMGV
jgi:hypothetical protein